MLPFFNQARARQRATTAQSVAHQVLHLPLSLPRSINLFALRPRHLTPLNVPTPLPPFPSYCSSAATPAVCLPISRFLNSFLLPSTSLSPLSLPLYLSLDAHFCLSARINFNGPHTPHAAAPQPVPPAHRSSFSLSFPLLFLLLVLSLVIRNPSVFGQLCACARIRNERWRVRVRVRGPPSPSRLSSHYAYAALRRTYTCCRSRCMPRTSLVNNSC